MVLPAANRATTELHWPDWNTLKLSRWQHKFLLDPNPRKLAVCGRGAGKSFAILVDAILAGMNLYPERVAYGGYPRPGPLVVIGVVAPNLQNLRDLWAMAKMIVPRIPGKTREGEPRYLVRENTHTIWLFGQSRGIEIRFMSAWLPNSMRSASIDILVCDEWAFCGFSTQKQRAVEGLGKAGDEVYYTILEKLIVRSFCYGKVTVASTPLSNYFDDWCQNALAGNSGDFGDFSCHHATALDNDFLTAEQRVTIEGERSRNEWKYRQERLAELHVVFPRFTATDAAFQSALIDGCLVEELPGSSRGPYAIGLDVSWLGPDWLAVLVADVTLNMLVHVELHAKTDVGDILALMKRLHETWKPAPGRFGYDATGEGKSLAKLVPAHWRAEPVYFWDNQKPHLVRAVEMRMQHGAFRVPHPDRFDFSTLPGPRVAEQDQRANFAQLVAEFRDYRKREDTLTNGTKRIRYMKGDLLKRDDTCDAASVLCHVLPSLSLVEGQPQRAKKLAAAFRGMYGS